jgi:hypothetical protein
VLQLCLNRRQRQARPQRPITRLAIPSQRRWPFRTACGPELPLRPRWTSKSSTPTSVASFLGVEPLRLLPEPMLAESPSS